MGYILPFSFAQDTNIFIMKSFLLFTACLAVASAQYVHYGAGGYTYGAGAYPYVTGAYPYAAGAYPVVTTGATYVPTYTAPVAAPVVAAAPAVTATQFHGQDELGNTQYGYSNINSAKHEVGNAHGVQGTYSYVDANGIVQTTNYIADDLGFRVSATNLPVGPGTPKVVATPVVSVAATTDVVAPATYTVPVAAHTPVTYAAPAPVVAPITYAAAAPIVTHAAPVHHYTLPVAPTFDGKAPEPVQDTPEVAAAKAAHIALVKANQLPVHTYTLPVAPVHEYELPVAPVFDGEAPEPVQDTPEVAAAKAAHIALVEANALPKAPEFYDLPVAPVDTPEVAAAKAEHMKAVEAALAGQTYAPTYTHTAPPAEVKVVEAPAAIAYTAAPIAAPIAPLAARLPYAGYAGYHYAATPAVTTAAVAPTTVVASAPITTAYAGYGYPAGYGYAAGYGYNAYAAGYVYGGYGYPYGYVGAYPAAYSAYTPYAGYAGYGYAATPVTTAHAVTHKVE